MINILTIDLEDWYQGIELDASTWDRYEPRIEHNTHKILSILDENKVYATFFVLGHIANSYPHLVKEIASLGHEIGTHGYEHRLVYKISPDEFSCDIKRSILILEDITGKPIKGHRAPYFSITKKSIWAFDILSNQGILYDSSIFPINNYRYGIPDAPRHMFSIKTYNGYIIEVPITTIKVLRRNLFLTGGFYLRFFPYWAIKRAIRKVNSEGLPAMVYLHPWELDPDHPRLKLPLRISLTHYHNLESTEIKLRKLLQEFSFQPAIEFVEGLDKVQI